MKFPAQTVPKLWQKALNRKWKYKFWIPRILGPIEDPYYTKYEGSTSSHLRDIDKRLNKTFYISWPWKKTLKVNILKWPRNHEWRTNWLNWMIKFSKFIHFSLTFSFISWPWLTLKEDTQGHHHHHHHRFNVCFHAEHRLDGSRQMSLPLFSVLCPLGLETQIQQVPIDTLLPRLSAPALALWPRHVEASTSEHHIIYTLSFETSKPSQSTTSNFVLEPHTTHQSDHHKTYYPFWAFSYPPLS
jgi:hypothetical protein